MTLKKSIWISKPYPLKIIITTKNIKSLILKYKDGQFHLSKPTFISEKEAIEWLETLTAKQYEKLKSVQKIKQSTDFIYLFGRKYDLKIYDMNIRKVRLKENTLCVYHKNYLETYLKEALKKYIEKRIFELALVDFKVKVEIQKMSSKYGCCFYTQQRVKFAMRLVHEPQEVIDSIIIHELAHFYYPNHSRDFYDYVLKHDKQYHYHQEYLKMGGAGDDPIG